MRFKLDENLGIRTQHLFRVAGYDIHTVREEGLQGISDQELYEVCCSQQYCLVTLDLDFVDAIRFPAQRTGGIVILRLPRNPSLSLLEALVRQFLQMLATTSVEKQLWIVEIGRIRVRQCAE